jgi:hypothetical protein
MFASHRFLPEAIPASISYVHQNAFSSRGVTSGSSYIFQPTVAASAGNKVTLFASIYSATGAAATDKPTGVTDSAGNTWTTDVVQAATGGYVAMGVFSSNLTTALSTSSNITVALGGALSGSSTVYWKMDEWHFPSATGVDKIGTGTSSFGKSCTAQLSASTTNSQDLLLAAVDWQSSAGTVSGPTGFSQLADGVWYALPGNESRFSASFSWTNDSNAAGILVAYLP